VPENSQSRVTAYPNAFRAWPGLEEVRVDTMERFPFLIPYAVEGVQLVVLAIAHAKKRPGYWTDRVR
jgi:hypothetical protein